MDREGNLITKQIISEYLVGGISERNSFSNESLLTQNPETQRRVEIKFPEQGGSLKSWSIQVSRASFNSISPSPNKSRQPNLFLAIRKSLKRTWSQKQVHQQNSSSVQNPYRTYGGSALLYFNGTSKNQWDGIRNPRCWTERAS